MPSTGRLWLAILLPALVCAAQFEVATIKPSNPTETNTTFYSPAGDRFQVDAITARGLIAYAYNVREFQISGAPAWVDSDRFDVLAKAGDALPEDGLNWDNMRSMVKALLADRMALQVHKEQKEMAVISLTVAKAGSKLAHSRRPSGPTFRGRPNSMFGTNLTMDMLCSVLAERLERPVLNRTGLDGQFDVRVQWSGSDGTDTGPSIYTAFEEQLGLKLESDRARTDILVVDHVDHPSPN